MFRFCNRNATWAVVLGSVSGNIKVATHPTLDNSDSPSLIFFRIRFGIFTIHVLYYYTTSLFSKYTCRIGLLHGPGWVVNFFFLYIGWSVVFCLMIWPCGRTWLVIFLAFYVSLSFFNNIQGKVKQVSSVKFQIGSTGNTSIRHIASEFIYLFVF